MNAINTYINSSMTVDAKKSVDIYIDDWAKMYKDITTEDGMDLATETGNTFLTEDSAKESEMPAFRIYNKDTNKVIFQVTTEGVEVNGVPFDNVARFG